MQYFDCEYNLLFLLILISKMLLMLIFTCSSKSKFYQNVRYKRLNMGFVTIHSINLPICISIAMKACLTGWTRTIKILSLWQVVSIILCEKQRSFSSLNMNLHAAIWQNEAKFNSMLYSRYKLHSVCK